MRHLSARRTLSAALVLALGLSLAASCAQKQEEPEQTTGTGEANTYLSPATQSEQTEPTYDNTFTQAPNPIPTPNPTPDPTTITVNRPCNGDRGARTVRCGVGCRRSDSRIRYQHRIACLCGMSVPDLYFGQHRERCLQSGGWCAVLG